MKGLRAGALALTVWMTLACAGVGENVFEWSTGAEMEEKEDGQVTIVMPNGEHMLTQVEVPIPDDFLLPPPPWDAPLASTVTRTTKPDGNQDITVTFQPVKRPRKEVMAYYRGWMKSQEGKFLEDERKPLPGLVIHSLILSHDREHVVLNITEGYGFSTLSMVYTTSFDGEDEVESKKARSSD